MLLLLLVLSAVTAAAPRGTTSPGKPRAPVRISANTGEHVPGDAEVKVTLTFEASVACERLETEVMARHGAELLDPRSKQAQHGAVTPEKAATQLVVAKVPHGLDGELVVFARCFTGKGQLDLVQVIPFAAVGKAGEAPVRFDKPDGVVETDEKGREVKVLRSEP